MRITNALRRKAIAAGKREVRWRRKTYPRLITRGLITEEFATNQINYMKALIALSQGKDEFTAEQEER